MQLIRRNVGTIVRDTMKDTPVTVIQGARQVGKSTLAAMVTEGIDCLSVTLDSDATLAAAKENPFEFVSQFQKGIMIIDEVQKCPELLNAIKLSVDKDRRPGRFLITGSANILHLKGVSESLAGNSSKLYVRANIAHLVGIPESSINGYIRLLEDLCLIHSFPAWGKTTPRGRSASLKLSYWTWGFCVPCMG